MADPTGLRHLETIGPSCTAGRAQPPWTFPDRDGIVEVIPDNTIRLDDLEAVAEAASTGAGLAWLPAWLVRDRITKGALVEVLADRPPFLYDCHALWLQTPHLPLEVRLAVDAIAAELPRLVV